jgi:hypothetical protein
VSSNAIASRISGKLISNDEFYTPAEPILELCELLKLPKTTIIWCPFDTKDSMFVKVFSEQGYQVMYSHISTGGDFFTITPPPYDIIISNPPFKNKKSFIERCQQFGKPYVLLQGGHVATQNAFANVLNSHNLYFIYKPILFTSNTVETKKFLCLWLMKGIDIYERRNN